MKTMKQMNKNNDNHDHDGAKIATRPAADGAALLEELSGLIQRFVVVPKSVVDMLALWVVHTYAFELREVTTYVGIESPEKRCGKTTLLTVLSKLVNRPVLASNISSPAFFRVIEEVKPTLLIDEADTFLQGNDELRGILNSGYSRDSAFVWRVGGQAAKVRSAEGRVAGVRGAECGMRSETGDKVQSGAKEIPKSKSQTPTKSQNPNSNTEHSETGGRSSNGADKPGPVVPGGGDEIEEDESRIGSGRPRVWWPAKEQVQDPKIPTSNVRRPETSQQSNSKSLRSELQSSAEEHADSGLIPPDISRGPQLGKFSCWCPKAVSAIRRLPDTLADRCVMVRMKRKLPSERCERLRHLEIGDLATQCARFVEERTEEIAKARPEIPAELNDRAADIWEPLLAIADLGGGDWPQRARQAAVELTTTAHERSVTGSLLMDMFLAFVRLKRTRMFTLDLMIWLNDFCEARPWQEARNGRKVTEMWIAQQLRPFGVTPKPMRIGNKQRRGYEKADVVEVCRRYVPQSELALVRKELLEM
jgi:uncharacterized protein DUF3631